LLIRHAHVLCPDGEFLMGDVQINGQEIIQVAPSIAPELGAMEIDAQDLTLLPGANPSNGRKMPDCPGFSLDVYSGGERLWDSEKRGDR